MKIWHKFWTFLSFLFSWKCLETSLLTFVRNLTRIWLSSCNLCYLIFLCLKGDDDDDDSHKNSSSSSSSSSGGSSSSSSSSSSNINNNINFFITGQTPKPIRQVRTPDHMYTILAEHIWPIGFLWGWPISVELFVRGSKRPGCWQRQLHVFSENVFICDIYVLMHSEHWRFSYDDALHKYIFYLLTYFPKQF